MYILQKWMYGLVIRFTSVQFLHAAGPILNQGGYKVRANYYTPYNALSLFDLDITPKDIETIYQNIRKKYTLSMEEMTLEMTKMQIAGLVEGNGAYYRLTCAL